MPEENYPYKMNKSAFTVVSITDDQSDVLFWQTKSPKERLESLELTRQVLYGYVNSDQRLQRVFRVIKLAQS
jgi:hypothetical protein